MGMKTSCSLNINRQLASCSKTLVSKTKSLGVSSSALWMAEGTTVLALWLSLFLVVVCLVVDADVCFLALAVLVGVLNSAGVCWASFLALLARVAFLLALVFCAVCVLAAFLAVCLRACF